MSIFLLATDTARRMPVGPGGAPPPAPPAVAGAPAPAGGALASAITAITAYIPAETITLFVAVTGLIAGWQVPAGPARDGAFMTTFYVFLMISSIFYVIATIIAGRSAGRACTITPKSIWRFVALTVAFVVWSCAVSSDTTTALVDTWKINVDVVHLRDIVSIVVLITSGVLSALDGLFP